MACWPRVSHLQHHSNRRDAADARGDQVLRLGGGRQSRQYRFKSFPTGFEPVTSGSGGRPFGNVKWTLISSLVSSYVRWHDCSALPCNPHFTPLLTLRYRFADIADERPCGLPRGTDVGRLAVPKTKRQGPFLALPLRCLHFTRSPSISRDWYGFGTAPARGRRGACNTHICRYRNQFSVCSGDHLRSSSPKE